VAVASSECCDDAICIKLCCDMCFERLGAVNNTILCVRVATSPTPGAEEFAAFLELGREGGAQAGTGGCGVVKLVVPVPQHGGGLLAVEPRVASQATHVRRRVLQVVVPGDGHVKVELASLAPVGPWRAAVLFHDEGGPL